jgi:HSP20 family protein
MKRFELEEKVDDFGWPAFETRGAWRSSSAPDLDLFVKNNQLVARMDLPGLTREHITVDVRDDELTIHGTWPQEADAGHEHLHRCACESDSFFRTVPLPARVTPQDVNVTFADGVLEVSIAAPRRRAAVPGQVEIEEPLPCS